MVARWVLAVAGAALVVGCGTPAEDSTASGTGSATVSAPTQEPTTEAPPAPTPEPTRTTAPPTAPPGPPPGQVAASWVMPNLVGQTLQQAQDEIQRLTDYGVFFTSSSDATGQGRAQLVDSNWKVCTQSVAAGATITTESQIEFGAVKLSESCP